MKMFHRALTGIACLLLLAACSARRVSVDPAVLGVADPRAAESTFQPPANALAGDRPRTLDFELEPSKGHGEHEGHGGHGGHDMTPLPEAAPSPATGHEHHHGGGS